MASHTARPVFATNASGVKTWTATYTPFGGVHISTPAPPTARFPGQWFQSESGLHQNWMRDYDPTTGRYLQPDPLGLIDVASVYGYVKQSPVQLVDPTGRAVLANSINIDAYAFGGGSFSWGFYFEWGCECGDDFEAGLFKNKRVGSGLALGGSVVVTYMPNGCKEDFFGDSRSAEVSYGPVSVEGGATSGGVGFGSVGLGVDFPFGVSFGDNTTIPGWL